MLSGKMQTVHLDYLHPGFAKTADAIGLRGALLLPGANMDPTAPKDPCFPGSFIDPEAMTARSG